MDGVIDYIFSFFWISHKTSGAGMDRFMNFRFMSLALIITEWYDLCVIHWLSFTTSAVIVQTKTVKKHFVNWNKAEIKYKYWMKN